MGHCKNCTVSISVLDYVLNAEFCSLTLISVDHIQDQHAESVLKPSMARWYHDLEDLMLRSARIAARPTLHEYSEVILALANTSTVQQGLSDMLQVSRSQTKITSIENLWTVGS